MPQPGRPAIKGKIFFMSSATQRMPWKITQNHLPQYFGHRRVKYLRPIRRKSDIRVSFHNHWNESPSSRFAATPDIGGQTTILRQ